MWMICVLGLAGHGGGDRHDRAVVERDRARVAGLSARGRIEDRPVEDDAAAIVDGDDLRLGLPQIGVVAKQRLRLRRHQPTASNGTSICRRAVHPVRHRQVLFAQEVRVEQFRLVARAVVAQDGHDRVAGAEIAWPAGWRRRC